MMTLTTVGYELHPATFAGKLTGGLCALLGVFILTLPIPIVVNSYASYYKNRWDSHPVHIHHVQQLRLLLYKNRWDTYPPHTHLGQQLRLLL